MSKNDTKPFKKYMGIKLSTILLLINFLVFSTSLIGMIYYLPLRKYGLGITSVAVMVISAIIIIIIVTTLATNIQSDEEIKKDDVFNIDQLCIEFRIIICVLTIALLLGGVNSSYIWQYWTAYTYGEVGGYTLTFADVIVHFVKFMIYDAVFVGMYLTFGLSIIRSIKTKNIKTCSGLKIKNFINQIKSFFDESRYKNNRFKQKLHKRQRNYLVSVLILATISGYCSFFTFHLQPIGFVIGIFIVIISIVFVLRQDIMTDDIDKVLQQIEEISKGNLNTENTLKEKSLLYLTGKELTQIQDNLQKTIEQKIKSERMKIELVTNVSHDLKTPLTSIISYIDLLSKEELSDECRDYVNVLKNKSDRLKNMVADLFTLAKVTSGEQSLELMELDFTKLVLQTLADMEDVINNSDLTLRTNITEEETKILGDGNKLYRSIQNIVDNAFKYSLKGTRIFLDVVKENDFVVLTLKNTSDIEITYTSEEIIERFFRGDKARTTEGNGLGLSIAKGFVQSVGGSFDVILDGDQFKVVIKLPLINIKIK